MALPDYRQAQCRTRIEAERALARLPVPLADLGLQPKAAKTRIVHLAEDGEGFDFLGFHHRLVRAQGRTGARLALTQGGPACPRSDPATVGPIPAFPLRKPLWGARTANTIAELGVRRAIRLLSGTR
ncbi:hypothetical protein AB0L65_16965 [Nonomuraea sp. NPDC052116]|uniref:hypothetical protein n=1 Tax=Nonomuraea sp. NPDC052116 TaxID=3155665 RepID=UPI00342559F7